MEVKFKQYKENEIKDYSFFTEKEVELIKKNLRVLFKEELSSKKNFIDVILYNNNDCNYFDVVTELFIIRLFKKKK